MRSYPVIFKKLISQRASDFGGKAEDTLEDIGPGSRLYAPGANVRNLTNDEKTASDLTASQEAIELTCVFTPILGKVNSHDNVVIFQDSMYSILSISRESFGNRQIKFVIGRIL